MSVHPQLNPEGGAAWCPMCQDDEFETKDGRKGQLYKGRGLGPGFSLGSPTGPQVLPPFVCTNPRCESNTAR